MMQAYLSSIFENLAVNKSSLLSMSSNSNSFKEYSSSPNYSTISRESSICFPTKAVASLGGKLGMKTESGVYIMMLNVFEMLLFPAVVALIFKLKLYTPWDNVIPRLFKADSEY